VVVGKHRSLSQQERQLPIQLLKEGLGHIAASTSCSALDKERETIFGVVSFEKE
jgi:hypothetical protein